MVTFIKEQWFAVIALPALAFLLALVWRINADLSKVGEKVDGVAQRVDRIANVLPSVQARVAYEELNRSARTLVITGLPKRTDEHWRTTINVINAKTGIGDIYEIDESTRERAQFVISGILGSIDPTADSFSNLEKYSVEDNHAIILPEGIISKPASYISYSDYDVIKTGLKREGLEPRGTTVVSTHGLQNWSTTAPAITIGTITIVSPPTKF
jgi:hypothetical protein